MVKPVQVGMVGMGVVGTGVARILVEHADRVERHVGRPVELKRVVVRELKRARDVRLPAACLTQDVAAVLEDPEIELVVQLMGGLEPAREFMLRALRAGKDVVTANKALIAEHGPELFEQARQMGRSVAFDAAVAGGIPIVSNINQCLSANQITSLRGILNGTSNFIVSRMEEQGAAYADAVAEAQQRGYAEADPSMDVDGSDAVQKLSILCHLAFGVRVNWRTLHRVGIDQLEPAELRFADELGYRIKLLAVARCAEHGLELFVSPTLVRAGTPLAEVRGAYNAVSVVGDMVGRVFYHGLGAGQDPTASAVVADLIDTAVGRTGITFRTLQLWADQQPAARVADASQVCSRHYWRLTVQDHPGVLAQIASTFGDQEISIASMIQHERQQGHPAGTTTLVIMTHECSEGAAQAASDHLNRLDVVKSAGVRLPVLD